jgi:hypothetical protein
VGVVIALANLPMMDTQLHEYEFEMFGCQPANKLWQVIDNRVRPLHQCAQSPGEVIDIRPQHTLVVYALNTPWWFTDGALSVVTHSKAPHSELRPLRLTRCEGTRTGTVVRRVHALVLRHLLLGDGGARAAHVVAVPARALPRDGGGAVPRTRRVLRHLAGASSRVSETQWETQWETQQEDNTPQIVQQEVLQHTVD